MLTGDFGNSIERHIARHFPEFRLLSKKDKRYLVNQTILYVFRFLSVAQCKSKFESVVGYKIKLKDMRLSLLKDGYVMKNLKLYLYYRYFNSKQSNLDMLRAFQVRKCDKDLYTYLLPETREYFEVLKERGYKPVTLYGFDQMLLSGLSSIRDFTRKFVNRKMKFIMSSQSQEVQDIASHLEIDSIQTVMYYYPAIQNSTHLTNIMKRSVHNYGINYIKTHCREKRGRIGKDANGDFVAKVFPIHSSSIMDELSTVENSTLIDGTKEDTLSLQITVEKLLSKFSDKRQYFLKLLMGQYDLSFTQYLNSTSITTKDNDVYWERSHDLRDYIRHALDFLGVRETSGDKFIEHLRSVLEDFKEAA